jgi:hypothetical protein
MIWHYNADRSFISILSDGFIKPATTHVTPGEKPIVWFSTEKVWEPTVVKLYAAEDGVECLLGMDGLLNHGPPLFRFGVAEYTAPMTWWELRSACGMS